MAGTLHEALARQREQELRQAAQERLGEPHRDRPAQPLLRRLLARRRQPSSTTAQAAVVVECSHEC